MVFFLNQKKNTLDCDDCRFNICTNCFRDRFFLSTSRTLDLQFLDYHVLEFLIYRDSICEIIVFFFYCYSHICSWHFFCWCLYLELIIVDFCDFALQVLSVAMGVSMHLLTSFSIISAFYHF